jgi:hypothetical protein
MADLQIDMSLTLFTAKRIENADLVLPLLSRTGEGGIDISPKIIYHQGMRGDADQAVESVYRSDWGPDRRDFDPAGRRFGRRRRGGARLAGGRSRWSAIKRERRFLKRGLREVQAPAT